MIKKIQKNKKINNQDKQQPKNIQELMQRYDLDNNKIEEYLDYLIDYLIQQKKEIDENKVSKSGDKMNGDLILDNQHYLDGIDNNGNQMHLIRAYNGMVAPGHGNYNMRLFSKSDITAWIGGTVKTLATKEQNILWQDEHIGSFMHGSQVANLSQKVSEQNNGIILQFRAYTGDTNNKYWYNYIFIPKTHVLYFNGGGVDCFLTGDNFSAIAHKYIYVTDTQLSGHDINIEQGTQNGITFNNKKFVLTAVIGV